MRAGDAVESSFAFGSYTAPLVGTPSTTTAIDTHHVYMALTKQAVPSIGR